jgi:hypothetical protein
VLIAKVLRTDKGRSLAKFSLAVANKIIENWDPGQGVALLCIVMDHSHEMIGQLLEEVLNSSLLQMETKLELADFGLRRIDNHIPLEIVSRTIVYGFKRGGMDLLNRILVNRPELGIAILAHDAAHLVFMLASIERNGVAELVKLVRNCLRALAASPMGTQFAESCFKLGCSVLGRYDGDTFPCVMKILGQAVGLVRDAIEVLKLPRCEELFMAMSQGERARAAGCLAGNVRQPARRR